MAQSQSQVPTTTKTSVLASGTVIKGNFKTSENLRVDGTVLGDVTCDKKIVIGTSGKIEGTIRAAEITVQGKIEGEAISKGMVHLMMTSKVDAKITATKLEVEEGAIFNGNFAIGKKK